MSRRGSRHRPTRLRIALLFAAAAWTAVSGVAWADTPAPPLETPSPNASEAPSDWSRPGPGETAFTAETWRAYVGGKTVVYFDEAGRLDGFERFAREGNRAEWRFVDGPCEIGRWRVDAGRFCFNYPAGEFCYLHLRRGGEVYVRDVTDGEEFRVELSDAPIACRNPNVSALPPIAPWRVSPS